MSGRPKKRKRATGAASWDPDFLERSPMLAPLREHAHSLRRHADWPDLPVLQALVTARNVVTHGDRPLVLVRPVGDSYEGRIHRLGELQVRERDWHDLFNVLAWLTYPRAKRELNHRHCVERETDALVRGPARDALTLFDESGAIVASSDAALLAALREFRWKTIFWQRRDDARDAMRFLPFGHALCEKALDPYVGLTAHALLVQLEPEALRAPLPALTEALDIAVAERIRNARSFTSPQTLTPLPVLGVPGWWPDNENEAFYDNEGYFRPGRGRQRSGRNE